ncbi:ATP-dependent helicase HrpB [Hydrogenovibrio sp. SC-1]|uniref:ATP-dependent helicase HrpB n=1 Tax=Hydrogenovibrio sp. SC-1 TaxID=2065820 RepID=UPI000C7D4273|nr:ATP-dependent helicase HrpB [Hydrogenovibrio sp. SC-1]PLA74184.1 ATP-dependent helicase HrpB [Hydrogenovibrio sp. SC-1]
MSANNQTELPITQFLPQLVDGFSQNPNWVLQAEPGAGKSTLVPLAFLASAAFSNQIIILLEPRRLAVRTLANYLAKQLGERVGETVGYHVRNDRRVSSQTRLEIVTEGILTRRLQQDPELPGVGLIIFDEFHERSIHADLALTLCLDVQTALRPELKLLVMSATIETTTLSRYLKQAPILQVPGRTFEVKTVYAPQPIKGTHFHDWSGDCIHLIQRALQNSQKDVLVFLPGKAEIHRLQNQLEAKNWPGLVVLPLYGSLPIAEQEAAIMPDVQGRRKVVLSTNLAETSLTIEGIDAVVDSGWVRKAVYDVTSGMTRLMTQPCSKASADQRQGRAGRLGPGICYRLMSESQYQQRADFDAEEITQTELTQLCMELAQWGVHDIDELDWLTPPPEAHFKVAQTLLQSLDLLTETGQLSARGQQAAQWSIDPRLARILIFAQTQSAEIQHLACDLVALLIEGDVFQSADDVDMTQRLLAIQSARDSSAKHRQNSQIRPHLMRQLLKTATRLRQQLGAQPSQLALDLLHSQTGRLLAVGFPDRIAQCRSNKSGRYRLSNGKGAILSQQDSLIQHSWLVVAAIDGQRQAARIFLAAPIDVNTLKSLFESKIRCEPRLQYDEAKQTVTAQQITRLGALILSETTLPKPSRAEFQQALAALLPKHPSLLHWSEKTMQWLSRVRWLAVYQSDWPNFDQAWLESNYDHWLSPYLNHVQSVKDLQAVDLLPLLQAQLNYEQLQVLDQQAPSVYTAPSGKRVPIVYSQQLAPKVAIQLQEVLGEQNAPRLAGGQVSLTFELLSPARRPIQTTADLAGFWQSSYFEVIKEMKGRYPKHRWPDNPLEAPAGHSIKRRQTN